MRPNGNDADATMIPGTLIVVNVWSFDAASHASRYVDPASQQTTNPNENR